MSYDGFETTLTPNANIEFSNPGTYCTAADNAAYLAASPNDLTECNSFSFQVNGGDITPSLYVPPPNTTHSNRTIPETWLHIENLDFTPGAVTLLTGNDTEWTIAGDSSLLSLSLFVL